MLLKLLLGAYVCINLCKASKTVTYNCTMPPFPKNGYYTILEPEIPDINSPYPEPGDKVASYRIRFTCHSYYGFVGSNEQSCTQDGRIFDPGFECFPYCVKEDDKLIACGDVPRCIMPEPNIFSPTVNLALVNNDDPCGTVPSLLSRSRRQLPAVPHIAGGSYAVRDELPWHAGVYTKTKRPYMQICGGTLVSRNVVISAAHCFWHEVEKQLPVAQFAVAVGKLYRPWNNKMDFYAQKSDINKIKIPAHYHGHETNLQDDIALLVLSSPITFTDHVLPVCLSFDVDFDEMQLTPGNLGKVAGWGLTSANGHPSQALKVAELPVVDIEDCFVETEPTFRSHITNDKFCAGYRNGTAVCRGDSGGGLSFPERRSGRVQYFLRGVVSGAPRSDHLCNTRAWTTFTRLIKHERFIQHTIHSAFQPKTKSSRIVKDNKLSSSSTTDLQVYSHVVNYQDVLKS